MKRIIYSILMLLPLVADAYNAKVGDIYYNLITKASTAEVTFGDEKYNGDVVIPSSFEYEGKQYTVTVISENAFKECGDLHSVAIANTVKTIGNMAFIECVNMESVTLHEGLEEIGRQAFYNCCTLNKIEIPNSVETIGDYAFYGCLSAKTITIGSGITNIGEGVFISCANASEIVIPDAIETIGVGAFRDCTNLASITFGSGLKYILGSAFQGCMGLETITIPTNIKEVGSGAFKNCENLKAVHIADLAAWCAIYFGDINANPLQYAKHLYLNGQEFVDLVIPDEVKSIALGAFYGCASIKSVKFPMNFENIGQHAFQKCTGLIEINIPSKTKTVGNYAFEGCNNLKTVSLKSSIRISRLSGPGYDIYDDYNYDNCMSVASHAFENCISLTTINIGNTVTRIEDEAFAECKNLEDVFCYGNAVPQAYPDVFNNSYINYAKLHVRGNMEDYKATEPWSKFGTIDVNESNASNLDSKYNTEKNGVFYSIYSYFHPLYGTNIEGATVTYGDKYYEGDVVIPETIEYDGKTYNVTGIDGAAFQESPLLKSVYMPNSITSIGGGAFSFCKSLESVRMPEKLTAIASTVFYECQSLKSIDIPAGITDVGSSAFYHCSTIQEIKIGNELTRINNGAFVGCTSLKKLWFGNSVNNIGCWAFSGCPNLTDVYSFNEQAPDAFNTYDPIFDDVVLANATLHVPEIAIDNYSSKKPWMDFKNIVALTNEEMSINYMTLRNNSIWQVYTVGGQKVNMTKSGLNIIKMANGSVYKVFVK